MLLLKHSSSKITDRLVGGVIGIHTRNKKTQGEYI